MRYEVKVSGRVQGVWYRETCRRVATDLGLAGWVRNNVDGTVEAVVEGDPAAADRLVAWMREGPRRAVVTEVEVREEEPRGVHGFAVR